VTRFAHSNPRIALCGAFGEFERAESVTLSELGCDVVPVED